MSGIFISYSHVDSPVADEVSQLLTELAIDYFRDTKDIDLGESINARVREAVNECNVLLVIISPASLKSHWVPYEIGHASALGKVIVPFFTHPSLDVPHYIRDLNYATKIDQLRDFFLKGVPGDSYQTKKPATGGNSVKQQSVTEMGTNKESASQSNTGLTTAEETVLKILANGNRYQKAGVIQSESGFGDSKLDFCLKSLKDRDFIVEDSDHDIYINDNGMKLVLSNLDKSEHPRLSKELTNAEITVLRILANGNRYQKAGNIQFKSGFGDNKLDFCLKSLKDRDFIVEDSDHDIYITHSGTGYLLTSRLDDK